MQKYVKDLIRFYKDYPALYREDFDSEGFEWVSSLNADDSLLTFMRKSDKPGEDLFVVVNFTPVLHEDYLLGVPYAGKYKETFNSDNTIYGGQGNVNPRAKQSKKETCDGREDSIRVTIPPLGISVYQCTKAAPSKKAKTSPEEKAETGQKALTEDKKAKGTKKKAVKEQALEP
jgi:1,4-alpha-glucan branching enzyme